MINTTRMADVFVDVADTLVRDFDIIDFLHNLTVHAAEITGCAAVGVLLIDHDGGLTHVAASSEDAETLELLQLQHSEGPCVDCCRSGTAVIVEDLASSVDRWPIFAPRAVEAGLASVYALPLRLRDDVVGALNVFGRRADTLGSDEIRLAQSLGDFATIAILQQRAISRAESLTEQLQFALNSRVVIEQAKGATARALGIGVDEAFGILRDHARGNRIRLTDLARAVVTDSSVLESLPRPHA